MDIVYFILVALVIAIVGSHLTRIADRLADQSGLGEALMGGVFLGISTSISGTITSVKSAASGYSNLSISNALGGIALQTFFLCIADISYKKSNLEHASASSANIVMGVLLIFLLTIPILGQSFSPEVYFSIHPTTIVLFAAYFLGLKYVQYQQKEKMWLPRKTKETVEDKPQESRLHNKFPRLWFWFGFLVLILAGCGYLIEGLGVRIATEFGISHLLVGTVLTALATSLPELVVTLSAVKRNAITLAIGGIIGGNTYDVLFLALSDLAYKDKSIYHVMSKEHFSLIAVNIAMTSLLLMGLLRREKHGPNNIGSETWGMIVIFIGGMLAIFL